jgi:large subunit ribosomal protein L24
MASKKNINPILKSRLKKGDKVKVITGKDKGKEGEVVKVIKETNRVIVSGVNMAKKHQKPSMVSAGGIVEKELSIHASNVAMADPKDGSATKVGFKFLEDGKKVRFAKKSGEVIS